MLRFVLAYRVDIAYIFQTYLAGNEQKCNCFSGSKAATVTIKWQTESNCKGTHLRVFLCVPSTTYESNTATHSKLDEKLPQIFYIHFSSLKSCYGEYPCLYTAMSHTRSTGSFR